MTKGKKVLAKLAKTKPTKMMAKPKAAAGLTQTLGQAMPQSLGQAFGP